MNKREGEAKPKKVITTSSQGNSATPPQLPTHSSRSEESSNPSNPSPWLNPQNPPSPLNSASFVEYLRWARIRVEDSLINSGTMLELFSKFENNNFTDSLIRLTNRTKRLAPNWFEATCPWRIRVGGAKGPESMLLPAFDALGMPFIPSSTLRGVARAMAMRDSSTTENQIKEIFGEVSPTAHMGQVIFLDAYPLPGDNKKGGLTPDMANAIWTWKGNLPPEYKTNPNNFLSLKYPTFIIGVCKTSKCRDEIYAQVKKWLLNGLAQGIGSQVNSGYGSLDATASLTRKQTILRLNFDLEGQLIHGRQKFSSWHRNKKGEWKPPGIAEAEVRPTSFRSMLRYWFRALALGILKSTEAQDLEAEIFGGIEPKPRTGLFRLEVIAGKVQNDNAYPNEQGRREPAGKASGTLILRNSSQTILLKPEKQQALHELLKNLTWLMFHLGGVGQGARRPCHSRQKRDRAPWWRGSTITPDSEDDFWGLPETVSQFKGLFQDRLNTFYKAMSLFIGTPFNIKQLCSVVIPTQQKWSEAIDSHCKIVCVSGKPGNEKPYSLEVLHQLGHQGEGRYDKYLCGGVLQGAIPSPVWIGDLEDYQVVTVFGATDSHRDQYLKKLQKDSLSQNYAQLFPII